MTNEDQAALIDAAIARQARNEAAKGDVLLEAALQLAGDIADAHPAFGFAGAAKMALNITRSAESWALDWAAQATGVGREAGVLDATSLRHVVGVAADAMMDALADRKRRENSIQFANVPAA